MTSISINDEAAHALDELRRQAAERQIPFDVYLRTLARWGAQRERRRATLEEFRAVLRHFDQGKRAPGFLPHDFSREDIYYDHD